MASGDTLLIFTAANNERPSSARATFDGRNEHPVLNFDDGSNENAVFASVMPQHYGGGGVTVFLHYAMAAAVSGDIDWDVAFERIGDQQQDIDIDSFATAKSVDNTTVPATSGHLDVVSVAFADGAEMDSIAKGEGFRVKVTRDAVNDTASGDAQLRFVEIRET